MLNNKTILITGGTGSFGVKFSKLAVKQYNPKKIIIYSRDEFKQYNLKNQDFFKKNSNFFRFFVGDVRDKLRLIDATKNVDIVIHAAALKQVETSEYNPAEFIKTNIQGASNLIEACIYNKVKKVVALSTDKAVSPVNLYGATKLCSDKLFISSNNYYGAEETIFSVLRYGNVLGSRGSVVPFFKSFKKDSVFPITDPDMTRFNILLEEGIQFVFDCIKIMEGTEIFVPKIKSYKILDLLQSIAPNAKTKIVGIRSGEKIHEEMVSTNDSISTIEFNKFFIIYPLKILDQKKYINFIKKFKGKKVKKGFSYNSKNNIFLSVNEIKKLINTLE